MIGVLEPPRNDTIENMRATIPKPVIAVIPMLLVVPTAGNTQTVVDNITALTPVADGILRFTVMVFDQVDRPRSREPGKRADLIVVDRDYFDVPADRIDDIRVLETWVGGERVFTATEAAHP